MSESVNLPALGESVTEGTVTRWLKNVGDSVEVDEPLLEVSTDKVDTEIPSPIAGIIEEILVAEDETVEVGTALVRIGDGSSTGGAEPPADTSADATSPEAPAPEPARAAEVPAPEPEAAPATEAPAAAAAPAAPAAAAPAPAAAPAAAAAAPAPAAAAAAPAPAPAAAPAAPAAAAPEPAEPASADPAPSATQDNESPVIEEVPSPDAPAPGQDAPAAAPSAPEPPDSVDLPPAASEQDQGASAAPAAPPPPAASEAPVATPVASSTPAPAVPTSEETPAAPAASPEEPSDVATASNAGYVTPLVRKLANEKGVDLSGVAGTGVGGRIRKEDVIAAAEAPASQSSSDSASVAASAPPALETSPLRGTTVPMSRLRKVIAERAVASMQQSAQLTSVVEADVTKIATFRDRVKGEFQKKTGVKLSFLPFFALAAAEALKAYPIVNATIDGTNIVYPAHENLSIAVDTERGLLTPVIRDAADLDLAAIAAQIADLAARTRDNKLKPDELAGGTFTLTNTGSRGALFDTPVVFLPQSAILGTGIVAKKSVVVTQDGSDAIAVRSVVYLALSYDHRIVDGADAARFLVAVKNRLEAGDFAANLGI